MAQNKWEQICLAMLLLSMLDSGAAKGNTCNERKKKKAKVLERCTLKTAVHFKFGHFLVLRPPSHSAKAKKPQKTKKPHNTLIFIIVR